MRSTSRAAGESTLMRLSSPAQRNVRPDNRRCLTNLRLRIRAGLAMSHRVGHSITSQTTSIARDGLIVGAPFTKVVLSAIEDLTCFFCVGEGGVGVAGDDGGIVEEHEEAASVLGEDDLLFGAFDGCGEVEVVGFFEFLAGLWGGGSVVWFIG